VIVTMAGVSPAQDSGTLTSAVHVTLVNRWLDLARPKASSRRSWSCYPLHDALVKRMPGNLYAPSLAESTTVSKDGLTHEFVLRKAKFHNGERWTAEDVKFSFDRYKGASAKLLKDKVKEIQTPAPNRVRIVLKEPWPDFMAFYGTSATGAGWIVPKSTWRRWVTTASRKRRSAPARSSSCRSIPGSSWCSRRSRNMAQSAAGEALVMKDDHPTRPRAPPP
jgi:peptide/nickel transport system substrate-binding protein